MPEGHGGRERALPGSAASNGGRAGVGRARWCNGAALAEAIALHGVYWKTPENLPTANNRRGGGVG